MFLLLRYPNYDMKELFCLSMQHSLQRWNMTLQHNEILVLHKIKKVSAIKKISLASSTAKQMGLVYEQQKKKLTPPGPTSTNLLEQWCGFFYVPQKPEKCKCCEMWPMVFHPYLKTLIICRSNYKGNTFFSLLKTLSAVLARVWARDCPFSRLALSQLS